MLSEDIYEDCMGLLKQKCLVVTMILLPENNVFNAEVRERTVIIDKGKSLPVARSWDLLERRVHS